MTNIWGFVIQTIEVSLMAMMLLFLKKLFKDKLSPRWQYNIWFILLITILVPAGIKGTYILPRLNILSKQLKQLLKKPYLLILQML